MDLVLPATWWRLPKWEMGYARAWPRPPVSLQEARDRPEPTGDEKELVLDATVQEPISFEIGPVLPEVLALNPNDLGQVLAFVRRFGPLGIDEVAFPEWEGSTPEGTILEWVHRSRSGSIEDEDAIQVVPREQFMAHRTTVAGFLFAAGALQGGNIIARELTHPEGFSNYRLSEAWPAYTWWGAPPPNESAAKERLQWIVDLGLAFFSLSIEIADPAAPLFAAEPQHCLYARCCVELVESMNAGHPYRQCRRCGRYFSRRPDAIYCSDRCKYQAQQERHRKRQAKKRATKGEN